MKHCSKCRRQYLDETLNFCLEDGEWLTTETAGDDLPTVTMRSTEIPTEMFSATALAPSRSISDIPARSIAVLPFAHLSSDADDEYFCDGLAEELLNGLSRLGGLKVAARTSAFSFKGKTVNVADIGRALGVETILEGSVRKSGERLRINAQLVNAADGYQMWSERYDRKMHDVFALQDEITNSVVAALRSKLLGDAEGSKMDALIDELRGYSRDVESYKLFLRGRFFLNKFTTADAYKAVELFEKAIELDPRSAAAHAGLADAYIMLTEMGPVPPHEAMPKAKQAALKALSLDADLAEAHSSLGMVQQDYEYDFASAEASFMKAISLSPNNPNPRQAYGILLTELGRHAEAEVQFAKVFEVDPLSVVANWIYSFCLFLARRYDDALERANSTLELDPNFGVAYLSVAFTQQMMGNYDESVEAYARCSEVMGFPENAAFVRKSYKDGWNAFLKAMAGERPLSFSSYIVAVFAATLGDRELAFAELAASYEKRESHIIMMNVDPRFDAVRDDPRFADLVAKIGFPV